MSIIGHELVIITSNFIINITKGLKLKGDNTSNVDILENVLKVFNYPPGVERIKRNVRINEKSSFQQITDYLIQNYFKPKWL